ncbi:hypothetical protein [Propylenella binzhouense]|uniref:Uncharacterized protein n=1 Tax=Propylenella binzhouense TaxID=2555902 RepID=A0A964WSM9_9HYPH|nr:hypothetical protein [Propylenella binzhouense]MYZ46970.1 hypothetical protein [Propylenella binzhouense]
MTVVSIARYLTDFSAPPAADEPEIADPDERQRLVADPGPTLAEQLAMARAAGREEERARANSELEARLAQEAAAHRAAMEEARARWAAEEGARIGDGLSSALKELRASLEAEVARALRPVVESGLRVRTVHAVSDAVSTLLDHGGHELVRVSGPADLLEAVRTRLGRASDAVVFEAGAGAEVRVAAGATLIETELGAWIRRLDEACD